MGEPVEGLPADGLEVVLALADLAGDRRLAAFAGGWSAGAGVLVTADPARVLEAADLAALDGPDGTDGPFDLFAELDRPVPLARDLRAPAGAVGGGWVSLLGHDLGRRTGRVRTAAPPPDGPRLPVASLAFADHLLRFDGARWWAEALDPGDGSAVAAAHELARTAREALRTHRPPRTPAAGVRAPDARAHMRAVEQVVHAVRAGDIAQANVCSRFALRLPDGGPAAVAAWCALVGRLRPGRAALVTGPWGALVGASPETYLAWDGDVVTSAPIKGTRPAGDTGALLASDKDSSENVMIVDLVRNDLSRVCEPGTVRVDDLLAAERHTGVEHLVSRVSGRLRPRTGPGAVLRATFPPGSVTGTPKQRASEVTDEVEAAARGAHTGAVGLLGPRLAVLAVTIRSLEVAPDGAAALGVGGGVVADSTPAGEWHEVLTKAAPLLRALGADPVRPAAATAMAKGLADPSHGLLETLLAVDGRALEVADHVGRLRRSWWELSGGALPDDVTDLVLDAARAAGPGWHRVRLRCGGDPVRLDVEVEPVGATPPVAGQAGLVLAAVDAPAAGAERLKFADRRWLDALHTAGRGRGADDAVLADPVAGLLETTRDCLLAVLPARDGRPVLRTPPLDGRVLPGVTRQVLLDLADEAGWLLERDGLDAGVLARADGLLAANALRGVRWVREVRGAADGGGDVRWPAPAPGVAALDGLLRARRGL